MDALKIALARALVRIDYSEGAGEVILVVDAGLDSKCHPSRYESRFVDEGGSQL
jgi:hypothetical protein